MVWLIHANIRSSPWYVGNARSRRSPPTKGGGSQTGAYLSEPIARRHNDSDRAGSHTPPPPVTLHRPPNAACRPGDCFGLEVRDDDQQSPISSQSYSFGGKLLLSRTVPRTTETPCSRPAEDARHQNGKRTRQPANRPVVTPSVCHRDPHGQTPRSLKSTSRTAAARGATGGIL